MQTRDAQRLEDAIPVGSRQHREGRGGGQEAATLDSDDVAPRNEAREALVRGAERVRDRRRQRDVATAERAPAENALLPIQRPAGTWLERQDLERALRQLKAPALPSWKTLLKEAEVLRGEIATDAGAWPLDVVESGVLDEPWPNAAKSVDPHNALVFSSLPSVARLVPPLSRVLCEDALDNAAVVRRVTGLLHRAVLWRHHGAQALKLDATTVMMLAQFTVPALPCRELHPPYGAFYVIFPKDAFAFPPTRPGELARPVEGVLVTVEPSVEGEDRSRELTLLVAATRPRRPGEAERYVVHNVVLTPDRLLTDVCRDAAEMVVVGGTYDIEQVATMRRVVVGLILYLMTQHPNVEAVKPRVRRDVSRIQSATKRRRAEQRDLRDTSLGFLYVRPPARAIPVFLKVLTETRATPTAEGRRLCQHQVRTHFRRVAFGNGRTQRRLRLIFEFTRGSGRPRRGAHVVKVQTAQRRRAKVDAQPETTTQST